MKEAVLTSTETHKSLSHQVLTETSIPVFSVFSVICQPRAKHMPLSGYCHLFLAGVVLIIEGFFGGSQQDVQLWGPLLHPPSCYSSALTFPHLAVGTPTLFSQLVLELSP